MRSLIVRPMDQFRQPLLYALVALLLFGFAALRKSLADNPSRHSRQISTISKRFAKKDAAAVAFLDPQGKYSNLIACLSLDGAICPGGHDLIEDETILLIFRADSLVWWSSNKALPYQGIIASAIENETGGPSLRKLRNGYYYLRSQKFGQLTAFIMIPVYSGFAISNDYLEPHFADYLQAPGGYVLQAIKETAQGIDTLRGPPASSQAVNYVLDSKGNKAFEMVWTGEGVGNSFMVVMLQILGSVFLLLFLYTLASLLARRGFAVPALLFLLASTASAWTLMKHFQFPEGLMQLSFFDPHYYSSTGIAGSIGDLLLELILILFSVVFAIRHIKLRLLINRFHIPVRIAGGFTAFTIYGMMRVAINVFRSLVVDSSISFDIDDLFSLDGFSLAGLLCVAVLLLNIYLIGRWFLTSWFNLDKTLAGKAVAVVLGTAFFLIIDLIWGSHAFRFLHLLWGVSFIGLYAILYIRKVQSFSFLHIIVWISFFALLSSGLLIRANIIGENEELRVYAERQSKDEDPVMEFLFEDAAEDIISDPFVRNFYRNPISGKRAADGQILGVHLGNYFDRYDININYFNGSSRKLAGGSESRFFLDSLITVNGQSASSGSLFHLNTGSDLPYIARLEIPHEQRENDLLYILFRKRIVSGNSIYPELLLEDKGFDGDVNYDFAVYRNGKLIESNGEFPYPLKWQFPRSNPEKVTLQESNVVHLLHKASEHKMIVVTRPRDSRIKPVSLFSYLFLFLLLITFLISVPATVFPSLLLGEPITKHFNSSLRGKIQSMVVVLTILSFLVIGIVTVLHFTNQYDDYHLSRLLRKVHAVEDEIEFQSISDNHEAEARITESLYPYERGIRADLNAVSEIHAMDVNIFDKTGNLIRSSQPDIFDKGLISRKMNPSAWETLYRGQASQCIQNENIGQLNYLSAYVPILSQSGEVAGYLNLPYFAKEKNLRQEISTFMVALINVYVFLLLGAGIVALLISNSITRSLSEIGEQFKKVSLGGKNEPIPWKSNDEIGLLVGEYNKMLGQLEDSADLLAQSERENAWRDMAKQVAHEIKNPLTPMRLSIQHLQRAYSVDAPNAEELTERVTRTILEQIDNLSHIASEFSNFAKMPEAKREKINLNEILDGVVNLFAENEEIKLTMQSLDEDVFIKADKNRMIRVFNNLIKNSIQAIPDDRTGVIEVEMINYSDDVEVRVIDNGSGIPEDKRARVFVPNFTTKNSGMGLGLSMSKNIVESAGGRISFVTEENVGTTFTVTIPKWRDS